MRQSPAIDIIVGLGNPGPAYAHTRHNAGAWLVERLASVHGGSFRPVRKFHGRVAMIHIQGRDLRLLLPDTWMNESGRSVAALMNFYRLAPESLVVAHDEIDFPCGKVRFRQGGGLAGHNGLRDISQHLSGSTDFCRVRIGVGRPGPGGDVTGHVLGKAGAADRAAIRECVEAALEALPPAVSGDWQAAMQRLHNTRQPFQKEDA